MVQQLLNEVWHCSLLHQIRRCLQLARTHRKWGTMCVNWMWLTTREPYPRCPSDWSRGGAKDQCSGFLSRFPSLSLSEIQPMYIQFTTVLHRSAECWLYVLSLPTELRVQDAFSYEWLLCACASCMLTISVIRATLVDSVCLCVCVHCSSLDSVMWGPCSFPWCNGVNLLPVLKPAFLWSYETFRTILKIRV